MVDRMYSKIDTQQQMLESKKKELIKKLIENIKLSFIEILYIISTRNTMSSIAKRFFQDSNAFKCYHITFNKCNINCGNECRNKCNQNYMKQILGEIYDLCITNIPKEYTQPTSKYKDIHSVTRDDFISKFSRSQDNNTCELYSTILASDNIELVEEIRNLQTTSNASSSGNTKLVEKIHNLSITQNGGKTSRKKSTRKRKQRKSKKSRSKKI